MEANAEPLSGTPEKSATRIKRSFSSISLKEAMQLIRQSDFLSWTIGVAPRLPSPFLIEALLRFDSFDLSNSEAAKLLLIDALLVEVVPSYPGLRVWKAAPLEGDAIVGIADYVIAPKRAYLSTPLLCAVEAKKDDFEQGRAQCVAEMGVCRGINQLEKLDLDVYGIVSNGQSWQFYKLTASGEIYQTEVYATRSLAELLGALDHVCAGCAANITAL